MAGWYYSLKGKAEGPVSEEFLRDGLKAGRFTLVDLVFREGDSAWCTLGEIAHFREAFQAPPSPSESRLSSSQARFEWEGKPAWVVLRKNGNAFEQTGPFSVEQIINGLAAGEFEYSQYAWKTGYKRWVRIGNLPEFDRRRRDRHGDDVNQIIPLPETRTEVLGGKEETSQIPTLSRQELMENVMRLERREQAPGNEEASRPAEADGTDLVAGGESCPVVRAHDLIDGSEITAVTELTESRVVEQLTVQAPPPVSFDKDTDRDSNRTKSQNRGHHTSQRRAARVFVAGLAAGAVVIGALHLMGRKEKVPGQQPEQQEALKTEEAPKAAAEIPGIIRETVSDSGGEPRTEETTDAAVGSAGAPDPNMAAGPSHPTALESEADSSFAAPGSSVPRDPSVAPSARDTRSPSGTSKGMLLDQVQPVPAGQGKATSLEIMPLGLSGHSPLLVFQTDIGIGESISVTLTGRSGEILELPSYRQTFTIKRAPGEVAALDLAKLKLPQGKYQVAVSAGDLKRSAQIFLGPNDDAFRAAQEIHLKEIAYQQQTERKALYHSAKKFESLAKELSESYGKYRAQGAKWRVFYEAWIKQFGESTAELKRLGSGGESGVMAYPETVVSLQAVVRQLRDQGQAFDKAIQQKRQIASQNPNFLVKEFMRIKETAAQLKGRPSSEN